MSQSKPKLRAMLLLATSLCSVAAHASTSLFSDTGALVQSTYSSQYVDEAYAYGAAPATLVSSKSFTVTDAQGLPGVTTFSYSTSATSSFGALSTFSQLTVVNPIGRTNQPAYFDASGQPVAGGMPDGYATIASASMVDTINFLAPGVTTIQLRLAIAGTLSEQDDRPNRTASVVAASGQLDQRDYANSPNGAYSNISYRSAQPTRQNFGPWTFPTVTVADTVWSNPFQVVNGRAIFGLQFYARAALSFWPEQGISGGTYQVTSDFAHTVRVTGVRGFDASGVEVALGAVVGESGFVYAVSSVPEPASWLLALGAAPLLLRRCASRRTA